MLKPLHLAALPLVALCACAPQTKYDWGNYSESLHDYYVEPQAEPEFQKALADIVDAQAKGKKVPPGVFAEYGYLELAHGNTDKAVELFTREKQAWPESAAFMDKAIANAHSGPAAQPIAAQPATPVS